MRDKKGRFTKGNESKFKGKQLSKETRKKMNKNHADVSREKNPMYGKHHSKKSKEKISLGKRNPSLFRNKNITFIRISYFRNMVMCCKFYVE